MRNLFDTAKDGVVLRVHVQPGAGRESVIGTHGDALKVRVVAPPVSGRANEALLTLLARELGTERSAMEITSGETTRTKRVKFAGVEPDEFERRLQALLERARQGARGGRR